MGTALAFSLTVEREQPLSAAREIQKRENLCSTGQLHYDKLADALLNTFFTTDPNPCTTVMETNAMNSSSKPYSVKSWPSSSFHILESRCFIALFPSIFW